jgi:putative ABC transport system permease protein
VTSWGEALVRAAAREIPEKYRDDIVADLRERHHTAVRLVWAIHRSARDARRHMEQTHRDTASAMFGWGGDIVAAIKQHRARPAGALAVILILAVAIGLNTALFSMVRGVLLRPLPFAHEDRVVFLWSTSASGDRQPMAPARALDLAHRVSAVESGALIGHISMNVTGAGTAERWPGASVSSSFFDVLGAQPLIGRTFSATDTDHDVVVLSHRLWQQRWHGDPSVVGTSIVMNGRSRRVVGVMPAEFYWPTITAESSAIDPPLFWTCATQSDVPERPIAAPEDPSRDRRTGFVRLVARLKPGVSLTVAGQTANAVAADLGREYPATDAGRGVSVVSAREQMFGPVARPMLFVWLASAVVVLGACVNVGTLILVRQAGRRREFAVRSALGASRWRLTRQLISETLVLSMAGGIAGVALARAGLRVLVAGAPESVGRLDEVAVDATVLSAAIALSIVAGVLLGGLSAAGLWRDRSADDLRGAGSAEPSRARVRRALVAIEAGLAVLLVVVAALFGESLMKLQRVDVGFDARHLLTFNVALSGPGSEEAPRQIAFYDRLLDRLRQIPGVQSAAAAVTLPIGGDDFGGRLYVEGRALPPAGSEPRLGYQVVAAEWFHTLGIPLLAGRDFNSGDNDTSQPVLIVNKTLADTLWPGLSAIGQRVRDSRVSNDPPMVVIGVVGDIHHNGPAIAARPEFYRPLRQESFSFMAVALRTSGAPMAMVDTVRAAVLDVDPTQPISGVSTMEAHLERAYGRARFLASLTTLFGALALGLAVMGVYGVTSFSVAQRTKEFGVRTALGASAARLLNEVLRDSLTPVVVGVVAGVVVALVAGSAVRALLFGTAPVDAQAYVAAVSILIVSAALGGLIPARRAARIDPVRALRDS